MKSRSDFLSILAQISDTRTPLEVFRAFVRLSACALAAKTREAEYLEEARRWSRDELESFARAMGALVLAMEERPFTDLLGPAYMDQIGKKAQDWRGEFHTPQPICELMARMTMQDAPETGPIKLAEPCCGSGAMILAAASALPRKDIRRLRVVAMDINPIACDMCFINTTLWGVACTVIQGNTLTLECTAQWKNVHALVPFLYLMIPARGAAEPAAVPSDALHVELPPTLEPTTVAAAAAEQGKPPTPTQLADLRDQLELNFVVEDVA